MKKKWNVLAEPDKRVADIYKDLNPLVGRLLYNRNIRTKKEVADFLSPEYQSLSDPFRMADVEKAVARVLQAVKEQEKVTIYADYDADAVTSAAVIYRALKQLGLKNLDCYIPDRFSEGYGINVEAIKKIAESKPGLIITVDCGTNSNKEIEQASKLGVDVVVTDHHHITGELPKAVAVINHKRDDLPELEGLTGVGTAFKLVQALMAVLLPQDYTSFGWNVPESLTTRFSDIRDSQGIQSHWEKWLLDLVAIGTVADCQTIRGDNRVLVKFGLMVLQKTRWPGLVELLRQSGALGRDRSDTFLLGFIIAPRLNAASRIQHGELAFKLLVADSNEEARMYAGQLEQLNGHRQRLTERIVSEARAQVELRADEKVVLAVGDEWPKGVVGLVAAKLTEEYNRPSIVLEKSNGVATGSARSIGSFDIVKAFSSASDYLERFGGHSQAAGLTIKPENIDLFYQSILEYAHQNLKPSDLERVLDIDAVIEPSQLGFELLSQVRRLEPFGPGNPVPLFLINNLTVESIKQVGNTGKHLKIQASKAGKVLALIGFNHGFRINGLSVGHRISAVVEISENVWNGRAEVQLKIVDLNKESNE